MTETETRGAGGTPDDPTHEPWRPPSGGRSLLQPHDRDGNKIAEMPTHPGTMGDCPECRMLIVAKERVDTQNAATAQRDRDREARIQHERNIGTLARAMLLAPVGATLGSIEEVYRLAKNFLDVGERRRTAVEDYDDDGHYISRGTLG
jgi:hypothetical protein